MLVEILLSSLLISCSLAQQQDIVRSLPGCESFNYNVYSGYLPVSASKSLHYVFLHSQSDPINDPVAIWFNGGPGASSLIGFFQEHGPCVFDDGESYVKVNPYPWNLRINMLYIESPAGVGFSYASSDQDLKTNDLIQSQDLLVALQQFYIKHPDFLKNDLYITGESYAGIYAPYLAWQIYNNNLNAEFDETLTTFNLKGIAVGNGCTNYTVDAWPSYIETVYKFHLIPKSLYDQWHANDCFISIQHSLEEVRTVVCDVLYGEIMALTGDLNFYDLYRHVYPDEDALAKRMRETWVGEEKKTYLAGYTPAEYTPWLKDLPNAHKILLGDAVSDYANDPEVREALNIPTDIRQWTASTPELVYQVQGEASQWIYKVLRHKYRLMHYSGDTDGAIPTYGSRRWIGSLGWDITEPWRMWRTDGQLSGYIEKYDGIDFITVHGVGHMSPQWKRKDVNMMISAWIHGEEIDQF